MKITTWRLALFSLVICMGATAQGHAIADSPGPSEAVFATVNGEVILQGSYENALRVGGRQRFYHGRAPEAELVAFRKEVAERLIMERLMHQEAGRRGLQPDQAWVDSEFAKIERRYSVSPQWDESGENLKEQIRIGLEERSLIKQVDDAYRIVDPPTDAEVRSYYALHPEKFTSPEQIRVSTILLKVEPWQPRVVWEQRTAEAKRILAELLNGADFDAYAEQYPPTDRQQLGYLHRGMLADAAQMAIDPLQAGELTDVVTLLEGVAIFRLDERIAPRLNAFDAVRDRAVDLLAREQSERVYRQRLEALRGEARVTYENPEFYVTTAVSTLQDDAHRATVPKQKE